MHRILSPLVVLVVAATASAQIPNASFENWTDGFPDGWITNNVPGFAEPVSAVDNAAAGDLALQGEVKSYFGFGLPPSAWTFFETSERPGSLTGSYIFNPVGGDSMYITIFFYDLSAVAATVGVGGLVAPPTGSSYQEFSVPIVYADQGKGGTAADTCHIQIGIFGEDSVHVGSKMIIDNLAFSASSVAVEDDGGVPAAFALQQNYPNPFNPATTIQYTLPVAGHVTLTVSNLLGETVATIVDSGQPAGQNAVRFGAAGLPSGLYFYTLRSGALVETRRMTLMK
ncbi:MAG TPA: T9SS type A sorting domain-containing protein [Rhodothermales bacterium]|nr:T9SS type A sorting domain-containing protein [Rhodothermales bacterium]